MRGIPRISTRTAPARWLLGAAALLGVAHTASAQPLFLADPESTPRVAVAWPVQTPGAEPVRLEGDRPYAHDSTREPLGENISAFVALGGTRMRMGAGHPRAASVKVGLYKIDPFQPLFRDLPPGGRVTIELRNLRFSDDPAPRPQTPIMHLKYDEGDLQNCGISSTARDQYNLVSKTDTAYERLRPGIDTRLGVLDGSEPTDGLVTLRIEPDGSVSMRAEIPYWLFRHLSDPWRTDIPGTFIEPYHFHLEFEVIPASAAEIEQIEPSAPMREAGGEESGAAPAPRADPEADPDDDEREQD